MRNLFFAIANKLDYDFPEDYTAYMVDLNPLKFKNNKFMTVRGKEKVLRCLLSFDSNDKYYYILKFQKLDSELEKKIVPFALLEFGDLLCFDRKTNNVVLYSSESDSIEMVANSFTDLLDKLSE